MNGDMVGRVIKGRYKLIDERGRGSFATVYVARDMENNHIYAVKIMHLELAAESDLLARFQREAHIHLKLIDPFIVRLVDFGNDDDMHYIVMEYVDGQNLKHHMLTQGPMEPLRALKYTQQIAEGLDAAYKRGVVHRDIKPQNILINTNDMVEITDFGLARSRETVTLTQSNVFMGTAYYISPEQAESGRSADIRSDLYSVAVVLFEMLAGTPPFEGETAMDIVIKHMHATVPSLSHLRPDLPPQVDSFMHKAMAKSPADRFSTPREFIAALEHLQEQIRAMPRVAYSEDGQKPRKPNPDLKPGSATQKKAQLVMVTTGQAIPLVGESMVVGRQDPILNINPEIHLADKTVGRRHACLRNRQGIYTVEDLHAMNKTRLNGVILTPNEERQLKDGDVLRFGSVEVRFELR